MNPNQNIEKSSTQFIFSIKHLKELIRWKSQIKNQWPNIERLKQSKERPKKVIAEKNNAVEVDSYFQTQRLGKGYSELGETAEFLQAASLS